MPVGRWVVDAFGVVVAAGTLHHGWPAEIDMDASSIVEDQDGFRVNLLVYSEDGGVDVEGADSADYVVVQCVDTIGIGAEEHLVDRYTQL